MSFPKPRRQTMGPVAAVPPAPNRFAYWIAAQVILPNGSMDLVTEEFSFNSPVDSGAHLRQVEAVIAGAYKASGPGGVPVVGQTIRAHVISFAPLRAWYQPPDEPAAAPTVEAPGV